MLFIRLCLKCDGTCAETRFRFTAFEMWWKMLRNHNFVLLLFKYDGRRAENRFRLSVKQTSPFQSAGGGRQFSRLLAAEVCALAVVMLDIPRSEVVWRVLATHSIRQFPSLPLPCVNVYHHISTGLYTQLHYKYLLHSPLLLTPGFGVGEIMAWAENRRWTDVLCKKTGLRKSGWL
jgi:hypothetical protein